MVVWCLSSTRSSQLRWGHTGPAGSHRELISLSALCLSLGKDSCLKTTGWSWCDASPKHFTGLQLFGAQRHPEVVSLLLISLDGNSWPVPDALHVNMRQIVTWRRYRLCQCGRKIIQGKVEWVPNIRPQADSVDRTASHNAGVVEGRGRSAFAVGGLAVPRHVQHQLGHLDCKPVRTIWRAGPSP